MDDDTTDAPPAFSGRLSSSSRPDRLDAEAPLGSGSEQEQDDALACAVRLAMLAAYHCGLAFGPMPCPSAEEQRNREWALDALIDAHVRRIAAIRR